MSPDLSWAGSRREGKASFIPVWLERTVLRAPNRPRNQPGTQRSHHVPGPTRDNGVRAQASTGPRLLAESRPSPGGAASLASLVVGLLASPQDPGLSAAASRARRCRARLPTCCCPRDCGWTPRPAGKVTKVRGSLGHRPGHWLSGQSRSCPLSTVPVTRRDFHGLHVLPLTAGDSLPCPLNCSAFGDPECPALRGGSARRESPREPAGTEGDPKATGPEPPLLLNSLLGETWMLDLEARGCGSL